jgi:hypothetical protein
MKKITSEFARIMGSLHGTNGRTLIAIVTIALFVISAGAPNAMIGIGK